MGGTVLRSGLTPCQAVFKGQALKQRGYHYPVKASGGESTKGGRCEVGQELDVQSQKNQQKEALDFYVKAAESNKNDFTTPRFLLKAGKTALALGQKEDALKYFNDIKDNYDSTPEAASVDALIGLAQ